tara:strand:- start:482 stop:2452 length:1971 start_codon:yes stop_codon:yes gene_type:complete
MAKYTLQTALDSVNIAEDLNDLTLEDLGSKLYEEVEDDDMSRQDWLEDQDEWLKLAAQVREIKSYPWQNASNVKFPLMTVAALQFHARALPGLVNSNNPVRARVVGRDPDGQKLKRANRIGRYMSYQVLEEMEEWLDDMDRMMMILPIIGLCYKKTFYSENLGRVKSTLVMPRDLILNYHAQDYKRARMSHVIYMDQNELLEYQNAGIFLDVELEDPRYLDVPGVRDETIGLTNVNQNDDPYELIESHCWLDLDEDGYKEPYIVTYHRDSKTILRIVARWDEDGIETKENGNVVKITATDYFTPFMFMPDPNSSVYGIGFGRLLGPTNEAVNTIINQLIDAGTQNNMASGFISRSLKLQGGASRFRPGEWKIVNAAGTDLKGGIVPLPTKEPSATLLSLLGLLIESGQSISSVTEMMEGKNPGQNTAATTAMATLEQGLKVFNGIYKRLHRALGKEYKKIYRLDSVYLDEDAYNMVLDEGQMQPAIPPDATEEQAQQIMMEAQQNPQMIATIEDFEDESMDVIPTSDPNFISDSQKSVKADSLLQKAVSGLPVNMGVAIRRTLEAEGHEDIDEILAMPPPQPSSEEKEFMLDVERVKIEAFNAKYKAIESLAKAEAAEEGNQLNTYRAIVDDHVKLAGLEKASRDEQAAQAPTKAV